MATREKSRLLKIERTLRHAEPTKDPFSTLRGRRVLIDMPDGTWRAVHGFREGAMVAFYDIDTGEYVGCCGISKWWEHVKHYSIAT